MTERAQRPRTMAVVQLVAVRIRLAHVVAQLGGLGITGPAAHHRAADLALADAAPLSNQLGEAILLHSQSKTRGDIALEG
jgi:hypothetical protein